MELICYTFEGWRPRIRPAGTQRDWMDASPESYAYRCLPLAIANAHGWEVLSPCGFSASWNGGSAPGDVTIDADPGTETHLIPEALFGVGTITFHIEGIIHSEPGWNLWVGGPPNSAKDGIAPLSGVIETDWSPFTFTMNWRFTRPHQSVRFDEDEPFAFIFPVQRGVVNECRPRFASIDENPELKRQFEEWSASRDAFQQRMLAEPPSSPSEKWQKFYHRGLDASGCRHIADHQSKLRARPFAGAETKPASAPGSVKLDPVGQCPQAGEPGPAAAAADRNSVDLAKRDWLLRCLLDLRNLPAPDREITRHATISAEDFLHAHYAANRPALLTGMVTHWPAIGTWTPRYLKHKLGPAEIEFQGARASDAAYERTKDSHRAKMRFDAFIDMIEGGADGNDAYITAYNNDGNRAAFAPLAQDLGSIGALLEENADGSEGMLWIGGAGTFTPLHHDLTNNLLVQVNGTKHVVLIPPEETPRLLNDKHVFSKFRDIENADSDGYPQIRDLQVFRTELKAGEALFLPIGWWHQVVAESFSVSITYTNFRWRNDFHLSYPAD